MCLSAKEVKPHENLFPQFPPSKLRLKNYSRSKKKVIFPTQPEKRSTHIITVCLHVDSIERQKLRRNDTLFIVYKRPFKMAKTFWSGTRHEKARKSDTLKWLSLFGVTFECLFIQHRCRDLPQCVFSQARVLLRANLLMEFPGFRIILLVIKTKFSP